MFAGRRLQPCVLPLQTIPTSIILQTFPVHLCPSSVFKSVVSYQLKLQQNSMCTYIGAPKTFLIFKAHFFSFILYFCAVRYPKFLQNYHLIVDIIQQPYLAQPYQNRKAHYDTYFGSSVPLDVVDEMIDAGTCDSVGGVAPCVSCPYFNV